MKKAPWRRDKLPREHGRAVIHVSPDAGPIRFTRKHLVDLVMRRLEESERKGGSVVFQVGIWEGVRERSAQVVIINGGARDVLAWREFKVVAEDVAATLCQELMQHAVMLELESASKRYRARLFENDLGPAGVEAQREAAVKRARRR